MHIDSCVALPGYGGCECRELPGNQLEGRVPSSLYAMGISTLALFRQEGCPLERYGRVNQTQPHSETPDFGVCTPWPVCPLLRIRSASLLGAYAALRIPVSIVCLGSHTLGHSCAPSVHLPSVVSCRESVLRDACACFTAAACLPVRAPLCDCAAIRAH
jgi:hypothetical protein